MPRPYENRRFDGPRGFIEVGLLAPGVIYQTASGHGSADIARALVARLDELLVRADRVLIFDDWHGMTGFDGESRRIIEQWTVQRRPSIEKIHVLLSSKLIAAAITLANLVTDTVTVAYTERTAFETALQSALARRR